MKIEKTLNIVSLEILSRFILGILFVLSGFVKSVDPMGVDYKIIEYFHLFGMMELTHFSRVTAILLCTVEIFIGLMLFCGIAKRFISLSTLATITMFTVITTYLVMSPTGEIQECGCFGDAVHLSNSETLIKNIFFLLIAIYYVFAVFKSSKFPFNVKSLLISIYCVIISIAIPLYSLIYLPPIDFLPFNVGVNILDNINKAYNYKPLEVNLIYRNRETGKKRSFSPNDKDWQDVDKWEYIETETNETEITNNDMLSRFRAYDLSDKDITDEVFAPSDRPTYVIIAKDITAMNADKFMELNRLYYLYMNGSVNLYLFTSSVSDSSFDLSGLRSWQGVETVVIDEVVLKSMLRGEAGVMLLRNGVIAGKWNIDHFPIGDMTDKEIINFKGRDVLTRYFIVLILSLILLIYFSMGVKRDKQIKERSKGKKITD